MAIAVQGLSAETLVTLTGLCASAKNSMLQKCWELAVESVHWRSTFESSSW